MKVAKALAQQLTSADIAHWLTDGERPDAPSERHSLEPDDELMERVLWERVELFGKSEELEEDVTNICCGTRRTSENEHLQRLRGRDGLGGQPRDRLRWR